MTAFSIRPATIHDAPALAALGRKTFCETFTHYSEDALERFLDRHYSDEACAEELRAPENHFQVATAGNGMIGYMKLGAYKLPLAPAFAQVGELHRLYVEKEWHGKKIGAALMEKAMGHWARQALRAVYLGVWEHNKNAQSFYARYGFMKVGEYDYPPIGNVVDREWIMMKTL